MSDRPAEQAGPDTETPQGGVFGNLPDSRPGGRSPRRDAAAKPRKPAAAATAKAKPARKTAAKPSTATPRAKPASPRSRQQPSAEPESGGGLEDIAWAGVAAAAEAATLGVRLANRALEALRGNSERN